DGAHPALADLRQHAVAPANNSADHRVRGDEHAAVTRAKLRRLRILSAALRTSIHRRTGGTTMLRHLSTAQIRAIGAIRDLLLDSVGDADVAAAALLDTNRSTKTDLLDEALALAPLGAVVDDRVERERRRAGLCREHEPHREGRVRPPGSHLGVADAQAG